jgi:nucleotide-binding universal stress UspA family protein
VLEALRRRAGRFGLDVVMVNVWEGPGAADEVRRYCELWGIDATVLLDVAARYARGVGVRGVPTNVFVDEHGTVQSVGATTFEQLLLGATQLVPQVEEEASEILRANRVPGGLAAPGATQTT